MNKFIINLIVFLLLLSIAQLHSEHNVSHDILFEKYSCIVEEFTLVDPDFNSNKEFEKFRTAISIQCKNGVNFANKYTIVTWGCGTNCQYSVLVDRTNVKIYDGVTSTYGVNYTLESNLLIVNEYIPESENPLDTTRYYIVNDGILQEIKP